MIWLKRFLALLLLVALMASYALVLFYCQGTLFTEYQQWYFKTSAIVLLWIATAALMISLYDQDSQSPSLTVLFFLPFTAPAVLPAHLLYQVWQGQISFNSPTGFLTGWWTIVETIFWPWRGLINRIVTLIIGIIVLCLFWLIVGWACGIYLPYGLHWVGRWLIALVVLWGIAFAIQHCTYDQQSESYGDVSHNMMVLGPVGTIIYFVGKIWDGESLSDDRPGLGPSDGPIPLYEKPRR